MVSIILYIYKQYEVSYKFPSGCICLLLCGNSESRFQDVIEDVPTLVHVYFGNLLIISNTCYMV